MPGVYHFILAPAWANHHCTQIQLVLLPPQAVPYGLEPEKNLCVSLCYLIKHVFRVRITFPPLHETGHLA